VTDKELNEVLKRAAVPERRGDYWERFPGRTMAEIERRSEAGQAERGLDTSLRARSERSDGWSWTTLLRPLVSRSAIAIGAAAVCLTLGFVLGFWRGHGSPGSDPQFAEARKCFQEIQGLFPHQLQAIVFDQQGAHLVLAQKADVPASPPLYLKICGPGGCQRFVTFSGQQIRFNGEECDVLSDHEGNVLVVGQQSLWASSQAGTRSGQYQLEARVLESRL
jgi:hypothetical protein